VTGLVVPLPTLVTLYSVLNYSDRCARSLNLKNLESKNEITIVSKYTKTAVFLGG